MGWPRMAPLLLLLLQLGIFALADDASYCRSQCTRKFEGRQEEQEACILGCGKRGRVSDGARGFLECHTACSSQFNTTMEKDSEDPERAACDFACSLPMTNVFMMKVDYGSGGEPKVQVLQREGGDLFSSDEDNTFDGQLDIGKLLNAARGGVFAESKKEGDDASSNENDSDEENEDAGVHGSINGGGEGALSRMFQFGTGDEELDRMQERMNEVVRNIFQNLGRRPSGHEGFLPFGSQSVGNEDADGRQILLVAPVGDGQQPSWIDMEQYERPRESALRHRFPALFQWTVCLVLLLAVGCTLLVAILMARHLRLHRYSALRNRGAAMPPPQVISAAAPGDMLKKIPIDTDDCSLPEPSGVPPPAYDQVSVHSKHASIP